MHNRFRLGATFRSNQPSSAPNSSVAVITGNDELVTRPAETQKLIDLADTNVSSPFEPAKIAIGDTRNVHTDPNVQITSEKPDFFQYTPIVALDDMESEQKLKLVNENRTWLDVVSLVLENVARESEDKKQQMLNLTRLQRSESGDSNHHQQFEDETKLLQRTNNRGVFHMGFPHPANVISRVHYTVFHVGLAQENMPIVDFAQQLKTTGCVRMVVPREVLAAIADNQNLINSSDARYHWKPLHIRLVEERNRLPIAFNLQITTRIPDSGTSGVRRRQQWVSPTGPNPWGGNTLPILNHVTQPGTVRVSKQDQKSLYVADDLMNSIEFNRWIQVDELEMERRLVSRYLQGKDYWVPMPDLNQYIATDEVQFVLITEMYRLTQLCAAMKVDPPLLHDIQKERPVIQINAEVLNTVLQQKLQLYSKSQFLMRLEDIEFVLTPVRQTSWVQELENFVSRATKVASVHESQTAHYSLKVEIAYENYSANAHLRNKGKQQQQEYSSPPPIIEQQQQPMINNNSSSSSWNSFYEGNSLLTRR